MIQRTKELKLAEALIDHMRNKPYIDLKVDDFDNNRKMNFIREILFIDPKITPEQLKNTTANDYNYQNYINKNGKYAFGDAIFVIAEQTLNDTIHYDAITIDIYSKDPDANSKRPEIDYCNKIANLFEEKVKELQLLI